MTLSEVTDQFKYLEMRLTVIEETICILEEKRFTTLKKLKSLSELMEDNS